VVRGAAYEWVDAKPLMGAVFYLLEDMDASVLRTQHGPVKL
jgi:hypothetical protein